MKKRLENIDHTSIEQGISYDEYMDLMEDLVKEEKTSGEDQSQSLIQYTELNLQRMRRLNKTYQPSEETAEKINQLDEKMIWLVLTESWCGDAAQNIPLLHKMAALNPKLELRLLFRDEHPRLMDHFLTNGGRSIPKMIIVQEEDGRVLGEWGPRPSGAQKMVKNYKQNPQTEYREFIKQVQLWYARDKGQSLEEEIIQLLPQWEPDNK